VAHSKTKPDSNLEYFVDGSGTLVSWVGYIPVELPRRSASGTYTIDDGEPVDFNLAGLPADKESSQFN
jgi:hypothetical protein